MNSNIEKSVLHQVSLKEIYLKYYEWCEKNNTVPLSKTKFSGLLKLCFKNEINSEKVIILKRSGLLFKGLNIISKKTI